MPRHGSALLEIKLEAEQPPGRIFVLLLENGPEQEVVRLLELFGNLFDRIEKGAQIFQIKNWRFCGKQMLRNLRLLALLWLVLRVDGGRVFFFRSRHVSFRLLTLAAPIIFSEL